MQNIKILNKTDALIFTKKNNDLNSSKYDFLSENLKRKINDHNSIEDGGARIPMTTKSKSRPFTNEKLSTALSPNMERQARERETMMKQFEEKPK